MQGQTLQLKRLSKQEKGINNLILAWIHCRLSAVSVDEGTSAVSVDQSLNSTGVQEVIGYHSSLRLVYSILRGMMEKSAVAEQA